MASPWKGRKKTRISRFDGSQTSISSFLIGFKQVKGTRSSSLKRESILPEVCHSKSGVSLRKKQTLLVPFDDKRMKRCHNKGGLTNNIAVERKQNDSGIETIANIEQPKEQSEPGDNIIHPNQIQTSETSVSCDWDSKSGSENTFGFFGVSSSEDEELGNYFDAEMAEFNKRSFGELPDEILENIFCQLPLIDLLVNMSVVSKRWHNVICNPKFLPWKKKYHRYKKCEKVRAEVHEILHKEQLEVMFTFPSQFSRYLYLVLL